MPSLRSGGFTLYADGRAVALLDNLAQGKAFNDAVEANGPQPRPLYAEDLIRGYRLDVWDSHTTKWHSLHQRSGTYQIADVTVGPQSDEGFVQLAAVQPDKAAEPQTERSLSSRSRRTLGGMEPKRRETGQASKPLR